MKVKEEHERADLTLNIQKSKVMSTGSITSWQTDGKTMETVTDFIWGAPKSLQMVIAAMKCSNYCTIALISHASKVMLKILQARFQQYVNCELPDVQAGFRKGRGTRDQIANICWIIKKAREFKKHLFLLYWLRQSLWLCASQ